MTKENLYQAMEKQIREQLRIAEIDGIRDMVLTPAGSLDSRSDALHRAEALSKARRLLDKLPDNYRATRELVREYERLT